MIPILYYTAQLFEVEDQKSFWIKVVPVVPFQISVAQIEDRPLYVNQVLYPF
jgi:hypothetical protein